MTAFLEVPTPMREVRNFHVVKDPWPVSLQLQVREQTNSRAHTTAHATAHAHAAAHASTHSDTEPSAIWAMRSEPRPPSPSEHGSIVDLRLSLSSSPLFFSRGSGLWGPEALGQSTPGAAREDPGVFGEEVSNSKCDG